MNVFRHDHISGDNEFVLLPDSFERVLEDILRFRRSEIRETAVATEGEKVHVTALLITNESLRHGVEDTPAVHPKSENPDLGHPYLFLSLSGDVGHPPTRPTPSSLQ